jgi:hypothetical protein
MPGISFTHQISGKTSLAGPASQRLQPIGL